jgi:hypothetical protein
VIKPAAADIKPGSVCQNGFFGSSATGSAQRPGAAAKARTILAIASSTFSRELNAESRR